MSFTDLSALGLDVSPDGLYAAWLTVMQALYPGYTAAAANPEVVDAQALAALMSDASQAAVVVPSAIVRQFGTQLYNVPYLQGLPALASVQVTAVDTTGYTLPAGTDLTLGVYGFYTQADLVIASGQTTGTVTVVAATVGSDPNGATNPAELGASVNWVSSVTALAPASGGVDPETDDDYQNRLAGQLALQAPRPITASDYATMALSFPPVSGTDDEDVGRATAIDGYQQGNASFTVSLTNASQTATVTASPGTGIVAAQGASITGTDIPAGTIVQSATSSQIVMSKPASATASGIVATVGGTLGNERTVTVIPALADGTATNADTKTALQAWLAGFREINFVVDVIDATYTTVYVTVSCHLYPGFDATATAAAIQSAITTFLSPQTFGQAAFGNQATWFSGCTIFYSALMSVIQNAGQGAVQYVADGTLKLGTAASPTGTVDLVLPGPVGLPESSSSTVTVTIV